jgi:putative Mg2+ transporter-C (MgtC) family protein
MHPELQFLLRLLVAAILAALLGWEREQARKSAGLRTHMLVGIASALYTSIAELAVTDIAEGQEGFQADPIRVIQAVAIGIGFLGSGVIYVSQRDAPGSRVHGLTTAASIWATAAIGIAVGLQYYLLAVGATIVLLIVLRVLVRFDAPD